MSFHQSVAEIERATWIAWAVTATLGVGCGILVAWIFRTAKRLTGMRMVSCLIALVLGALMFAAIHAVRFRIEEAPFETRGIWIHPGWISMYLPLVAILVGTLLARRSSREAAR